MQRLRGLECKWLRLPVSLQVKPRTNTSKHPQNESLLKVQGSDPSHEQGLGGSRRFRAFRVAGWVEGLQGSPT